jgi:hypothetical protein
MGCDIHMALERRLAIGKFVEAYLDPPVFDWRSYGLFGFLADVRNYSFVPPIAPQRGMPDDACAATKEYIGGDYHSVSWLSVAELAAFDYEKTFEDRRITVQIASNAWSGAGDAGKGNGNVTTFRAFLGKAYFVDLERLKEAKIDRIIFGFDS